MRILPQLGPEKMRYNGLVNDPPSLILRGPFQYYVITQMSFEIPPPHGVFPGAPPGGGAPKFHFFPENPIVYNVKSRCPPRPGLQSTPPPPAPAQNRRTVDSGQKIGHWPVDKKLDIGQWIKN